MPKNDEESEKKHKDRLKKYEGDISEAEITLGGRRMKTFTKKSGKKEKIALAVWEPTKVAYYTLEDD